MTSLGIMTLSRGPYNELDKMSLFQDLKLKRRKVDSRCSSDGESVADTSTSSPDLVAPLSPKMCDQPPTPNQMTSGSSSEDQSSMNTNSSVDLHRCNNNNNNNNNSDSSSHGKRGGEQQECATGTILSQALSKNLPTSNSDMQRNGGEKYRSLGDNPKNNHSGHVNQGVIRSVKSERSSVHRIESAPSPEAAARASPSSVRHPTHNSSYPHPQQQPTHNHTMNHSNSAGPLSHLPPHSSAPSNFNQHLSSSHMSSTQQQQRGSPPNPSHQHVTVLVNAPRTAQQQSMIQQHHQTTIVGIRRSSPPATSHSSPGHGHYTHGGGQNGQNSFRETKTTTSTTTASSSFSSGMGPLQAPQSQLQLLQQQSSSSMRGQMSPNSNAGSPSNNNLSHPSNGGGGPMHHSNGNHSLLAAAAAIPLQFLQQQQQQQHQLRIKRERSPILHGLPHGQQPQAQSISLSPTQHKQQQHQQQQHSPSQMSPMSIMSPSLQMRHPMRDAAILLRVKNELPNLVQQRMVWNANARINGVKPEIIGGPMPNMRPNNCANAGSPPQSASQTPPRATPTVIMGESCGVRTMVWGFEPTSSQLPPSPASSSSNQSSAGPSQNEEAAQLLLSLGQTSSRPRAPAQRSPHPLNMERLWAGDYSQLPAGQQLHALNLSQPQWMGGGGGGAGAGQQQAGNKSDQSHVDVPHDEDDQPLVCMICEDKATGLHYGIITCEGCKGFFKRTVQNRRVYTCVADGTCEITKAQRNRCQYCRFKKCIEQGMVLQAVREDRMPGGRNSGAVYNLYKVKYKKHKKATQKPGTPQHQQHQQQQQQPHQGQMQSPHHQPLHQQISKMGALIDVNDAKASMFLNQGAIMSNRIKTPSSVDSNSNHSTSSSNSSSLQPHLMNGTILKTALTNPSEIVHLRHRLDNAVSSSKDRSVNYEHALCMIQTLIDCDEMENIATLPHFPEFLEDKSEIGDKLCNIGDSIVHKLVSWTKKLPFYLEIPVEIHTKLLTDKWHELLVLTTAAYQALHGKKSAAASATESSGSAGKATIGPIVPDKGDPEFVQEVTNHLHTLQTCLTTLMGQPISMEQLRLDVGHMVEKMTQITIMFRRIKLKMEEYVCLKVYILLNKEVELEGIQERYVQVLRGFLQNSSPHNPGRLNDLLAHIPEIQAAASLLLESKMFYVPFVLNSASIR